MKKGEKSIITCTAPNAYGEEGSYPSIPPNATLIFEIEVIKFYDHVKIKGEYPLEERVVFA